MPALHLVEAIASDRQEIAVRRDHRPIEIGLDDALGTVEGVQLALKIGVAQLFSGDIAGTLQNAVGPAVTPDERAAARLYPDLAAALTDALVLGSLMPCAFAW